VYTLAPARPHAPAQILSTTHATRRRSASIPRVTGPSRHPRRPQALVGHRASNRDEADLDRDGVINSNDGDPCIADDGLSPGKNAGVGAKSATIAAALIAGICTASDVRRNAGGDSGRGYDLPSGTPGVVDYLHRIVRAAGTENWGQVKPT